LSFHVRQTTMFLMYFGVGKKKVYPPIFSPLGVRGPQIFMPYGLVGLYLSSKFDGEKWGQGGEFDRK